MKKLGMALSCLTVALLMGCGGSDTTGTDTTSTDTNSTDTSSSNSGSDDTSPSTYTFIDEAVKGLYYKTATQTVLY